MIRLVVIDDDPLVRTGLGIILNAAPDLTVVAEAGDGETGVQAVRRKCPDVVLLDVRMPAPTDSPRPAPYSRSRHHGRSSC
jgi:DNA-binding NarL/FixJ family response regulator